MGERKQKENWEERFDKKRIEWYRLFQTGWYEKAFEEIESFICDNFVPKEKIKAELEKIAKWAEPQAGAGEGLSLMAGVGMYTQYDFDKQKHERQIAELQKELLVKK